MNLSLGVVCSTSMKLYANDCFRFLFIVRFNGNYSGSGFTHVPGGDEYRNRSVFSYHYYCTIIQVIPVPGNESIPIFDRLMCDDIEGPDLFRSAFVRRIKIIHSVSLIQRKLTYILDRC